MAARLQAGPTGLLLDTSLLFHKDFLGMIRASVQFLFPAAHSRQAQGDQTCKSVVGQGTIWRGWRRATGSRGRDSQERILPGA